MLLLTDSISKEDSCWELRLRCGEARGSTGQLWQSLVGGGGGGEGEGPENLLPQGERERHHPHRDGRARGGKCHSLGFRSDADRLARFPPALSLFLMAVNIKTPVVVENITLMCLRILQKLIKPPAPTSKKNKVLLLAPPRLRPIPAAGAAGRLQQPLEALPDSLYFGPPRTRPWTP